MLEELLFSPFVWGLALGLFIALVTWLSQFSRKAELRRQISEVKQQKEDLAKSLNTQMSITQRGAEEIQKELEELKKQNENLRITVSTLQQKPNRAEMRTLYLYDKAIHLMYQRAPGFAASWEEALQEAETEIRESETGIKALVSKVFRPSLKSPTTAEKYDK